MENKCKLLIVEENPYLVDILIETLHKEFTITVANTGQEAARMLIQGNRFDCVLTELNLTYFGGLELTKLIRTSRLGAQTPIVILSDVQDSATRISCLEQGVDALLSKPFNPLEVKAKLQALLRRVELPTESAQRSVSVRLQNPAKSFWQPKSRFLSMLFGTYSLPQSI